MTSPQRDQRGDLTVTISPQAKVNATVQRSLLARVEQLEREITRAGIRISEAQGMCTDERPHEEINEVLDRAQRALGSTSQPHESDRAIAEWVSNCCAKAMTTAGGDGTHGSPCWTVCRACSMPCDPVPIYAGET